MIEDRAQLTRQIDAATDRLLATITRLGEADVSQPAPGCPGWSRGDLLTHVARSADAMRNLLIWARTGVETPAYLSQSAREEEIHAGAQRSVSELLMDVRDSAAAFNAEVGRLPEKAWQVNVRVLNYPGFPAEGVLLRRLVELELHHTDLGVGYGPADWPAEFATMELPEPMRSQREDRRKR
ncbi:MAG: maleylpyruvate isomerase [Pseudonocardiales bacterium]|nr:MAG: maleylpyruvate isomerase [Pseudonocardiales bacterium]